MSSFVWERFKANNIESLCSQNSRARQKEALFPPVWRQSCLVLNWSLFRLGYSSEDGWLLLLCVLNVL